MVGSVQQAASGTESIRDRLLAKMVSMTQLEAFREVNTDMLLRGLRREGRVA